MLQRFIIVCTSCFCYAFRRLIRQNALASAYWKWFICNLKHFICNESLYLGGRMYFSKLSIQAMKINSLIQKDYTRNTTKNKFKFILYFPIITSSLNLPFNWLTLTFSLSFDIALKNGWVCFPTSLTFQNKLD